MFILKGSSFLLGMRRTPIGKGTFVLPGGEMEFAETFEVCAEIELLEETSLEIMNIDVIHVVNTIHYDFSHYVTVLVSASLSDPDQDSVNLEPNKCEGWAWYKWRHLPKPLFSPLKTLIDSGFSPFVISTLIDSMFDQYPVNSDFDFCNYDSIATAHFRV